MKANGNATPRRPIEREYLAPLNAAVPLDTWQAICQQAADDALTADAKARDWLGKWLLGLESRMQSALAAEACHATLEAAADEEIGFLRRELEVRWRTVEQSLELSELLRR